VRLARDDRLAVSGAEVWRDLHRRTRPSTVADAAMAGLLILKHSYDLSDEELASAGLRIHTSNASAARVFPTPLGF
jgi:hypothetical protein